MNSDSDDTMFQRADNRLYKGLEKNEESIDSYSFMQLADTQLGMLGGMKQMQWMRSLRSVVTYGSLGFAKGNEVIPVPFLDEIHDGKSLEELFEIEVELTRKAIQIINKLLPKFVVVCGDLVHAYPVKEAETNAAQIKKFKELFAQVDPRVALVCTCGNHDIGDQPTHETIAHWKKNFGDDYFSFWVGNDQYIVLNSQLYQNATHCPDLREQQEKWLDTLLEESGARHRIVFSHIPPFINTADEPNGYFPLSQETRAKLLEKLAGGGVTHWFCGHYHRNAGGIYHHPTNGSTLEVIVTAAVGTNIISDPDGDAIGLSGMQSIIADESNSVVRIVSVSKESVSHSLKYLNEY